MVEGLQVSWTNPSEKILMNCRLNQEISNDHATNEMARFSGVSPCGVVETDEGASLTFIDQDTTLFQRGIYTCSVNDRALQSITKTLNVSVVKFPTIPEGEEISFINVHSVVKTFQRGWSHLSTESLELKWTLFVAAANSTANILTRKLLVRGCNLESALRNQCSQNK